MNIDVEDLGVSVWKWRNSDMNSEKGAWGSGEE